MTLRNLGIALALASVACTLDLSKQLPCKNIGQASECPGGQTCGTDGLCRELVADCPKTPAGGGAGHCATECLTGLTNCSGNCIDVSRDSANCGACGTKCGAGEQCVSGICKTTCPASLTECPAGSGKCVDTTSDRANCGA